eukprot:TRINITY_DN10419_c0_g1_i1.p1 TRINITY_DN10419_c0_g1~~TRINITY_DN10419_c0_g1_i1.p1  ORF type:complete len:84 (-),score=9.71 TRINITY_DN10419_c0_g1_i1:186-437(-)
MLVITTLMKAASNGLEEITKNLLFRGISATGANHFGDTALSLAAEHGQVGITQHLIEAAADPNIITKSGSTPIFLLHPLDIKK